MNQQYQFRLKFSIRWLVFICYSILVFYPNSSQTQDRPKKSNLDLHYKFRDNNRWEGVKSKRDIKRSGTLTLESLICYSEKWMQDQTDQPGDTVTIHFYSSVAAGINVSVFELDDMYFMRPHTKNFSTFGWNKFQWSADILKSIDLPITKLEGIAQARTSGDQLYFPIYFTPPENTREEVKLKLSLCSAKDAIIDLALYKEDDDQPILKQEDIRLIRDNLKNIHWKIAKHLASKTSFKLVATERSVQQNQKTPLQHIFHLYLKQL